jgi:hypothetical protein
MSNWLAASSNLCEMWHQPASLPNLSSFGSITHTKPHASACQFQTSPCLGNCCDLARRSPKRLSEHSLWQQRANRGCHAGLLLLRYSCTAPTCLVELSSANQPDRLSLDLPAWPLVLFVGSDDYLTDYPMHALCSLMAGYLWLWNTMKVVSPLYCACAVSVTWAPHGRRVGGDISCPSEALSWLFLGSCARLLGSQRVCCGTCCLLNGLTRMHTFVLGTPHQHMLRTAVPSALCGQAGAGLDSWPSDAAGACCQLRVVLGYSCITCALHVWYRIVGCQMWLQLL